MCYMNTKEVMPLKQLAVLLCRDLWEEMDSTLKKIKDLSFLSWKEWFILGGSGMYVIFLMW